MCVPGTMKIKITGELSVTLEICKSKMNTLKKFLQLKGTKTNIPKSKNTAKPEGIVHCTMNLVVA